LALRLLLFAILILSPLPFGSGRPIWQWLWLIIIACAAITVCVSRARGVTKRQPEIYARRLPTSGVIFFILVVALCLWVLLQAYLAPIGLTAPLGLKNPSGWSEISLAAASFFISYAILFYLAFTSINSSRRVKQLLQVITISCCAYAVYGIAAHFIDGNSILWFKKWASAGSLTSTFVNRNHFAAYAGLGLLSTSALLVQSFYGQATGDGISRKRLLVVANFLASKTPFYFLAFIIILTSLSLSSSRSGILSTFVALIFFIWLAPPPGHKTIRIIVGAACLALFAFAIVFSGENFLERLMFSNNSISRLSIFEVLLLQLQDAPIYGVGIGQFADGFAIYRSEDIPKLILRAHNDYLEFIYTLGWPAFVVFLSACSIIANTLRKAKKKDRPDRVFFALALAAMLQIGLQSFVDFPLQIPAIAFLFLVLLASIYAVAVQKTSDVVG
jgi:O-antigen ligase